MTDRKLAKSEIKKLLARLEGWVLKDDRIEKEFKFKDFTEAMRFMNALAAEAEKLNHHPDWSNSYNKVSISLTTHSVGGLSEKDFALAESADSLSKKLS